jgi:hypothetical protein
MKKEMEMNENGNLVFFSILIFCFTLSWSSSWNAA